MKNREFVLALVLVGAVAWTARAGDVAPDDRVGKLEGQVARLTSILVAQQTSLAALNRYTTALANRIDAIAGRPPTPPQVEPPKSPIVEVKPKPQPRVVGDLEDPM